MCYLFKFVSLQTKGTKLPPAALIEGSYVAALYNEDASWYRGQVFGPLQDAYYKILFIDYGNCEHIPENNLLPLPAEFRTIPVQGVHCVVQDIKPV